MPATETPPWAIVGAGAIGQLLAHCLNESGQRVLLLGRDGSPGVFSLETADKTHTLRLSTLDNDAAAPLGHIVVCCKAGDTVGAISERLDRMAPNAIVVLLQNGMGVFEELRQLAPGLRLFNAVTEQAAWRKTAAHTVHAATGPTLLGTLDPALSHRCAAIAAALSSPGMPVTPTEILPLLWHKLGISAVINPLTALHQCRNGELLSHPGIHKDMATLCEEMAQIAPPGVPEWDRDNLLARAERVARATAGNRSSMLQDVIAGRPTEIDYITGYLCRYAAENGIELPRHRVLWQQLRGDQAP